MFFVHPAFVNTLKIALTISTKLRPFKDMPANSKLVPNVEELCLKRKKWCRETVCIIAPVWLVNNVRRNCRLPIFLTLRMVTFTVANATLSSMLTPQKVLISQDYQEIFKSDSHHQEECKKSSKRIRGISNEFFAVLDLEVEPNPLDQWIQPK